MFDGVEVEVVGAVVVEPIAAGDPASIVCAFENGTAIPEGITAVTSPIGPRIRS